MAITPSPPEKVDERPSTSGYDHCQLKSPAMNLHVDTETATMSRPQVDRNLLLGPRYADGRPFYAMRFIKGDSLKDAIEAFHKGERPEHSHWVRLKATPGSTKIGREFLSLGVSPVRGLPCRLAFVPWQCIRFSTCRPSGSRR